MGSLSAKAKRRVISFIKKYKAKFGSRATSREEWAVFLNENKDVKDLHSASFWIDKYNEILDAIFRPGSGDRNV